MQDKVIEYLKQTKNLYQIKAGNISVTFKYAKNGKEIKDCVMNILDQKQKIR